MQLVIADTGPINYLVLIGHYSGRFPAAQEKIEASTEILERHFHRVTPRIIVLVDCASKQPCRVVAIADDVQQGLERTACLVALLRWVSEEKCARCRQPVANAVRRLVAERKQSRS